MSLYHPASQPRDDDDLPGPYLRRLRDAPIDNLHRLTEEIGGRPGTSLGEARAAALLDGRLRRAGLRASADTFRTRPAPGFEGLAIAGLAAIGVLTFYWLPYLACALQCVGLGLALVTAGRREPLVGRQRTSQNVIATRASIDERRQRLVLLARLDTPLRIGFLASAFGGRRLIWLRALAVVLLAICSLIGVVDPDWTWLYAQSAVFVGLLVLVGLDLLALRRSATHVEAAEAAGMAVLLAACEAIDELRHTELWAVGVGASYTGAGLADLLQRYPFGDEAVFIGLEGFAAGPPAYITAEGWPQAHPVQPELLALVAAVAADPRNGVRPLTHTGAATMIADLGWAGRSISVACLGPERQSEADLSVSLEQAARLVVSIARALDAAPKVSPPARPPSSQRSDDRPLP
jgi:hypothetical protein